MNLERGKGWREDDPFVVADQLVSRHVSNLVGSLAPIIGEDSGPVVRVDYTGHLGGDIPNQRGTNACVGFAIATALYVSARVAGLPIPRPSEKLIYDFARAEDRPYIELEDFGSRPLAAIRGIQEKGLVAASDWALEFYADGTSNVNKRPDLATYSNALDATLGSYYRIAPGRGASELVRHALLRGYCPVFAMPIDEDFERLSDGRIYEGRKGMVLGWHMQAITGFGDGNLIVLGSWGKFFALDGVAKIANDYFDSGECRDIIVPTAVPRIKTA